MQHASSSQGASVCLRRCIGYGNSQSGSSTCIWNWSSSCSSSWWNIISTERSYFWWAFLTYTYFSNHILGGGQELKARAKKWDEQVLRKLKERKRLVTEKLHKLQASSKRELDFEVKRRQIQSLESRLRYTSLEIKNKLEQIQLMENSLEVAESELNNIQVSKILNVINLSL